MKTDFMMIILTDKNSYVHYYDTWEQAQRGFIRLVEDIKRYRAIAIEKVILSNNEEIRITWNRELYQKNNAL